MQCKRDSEDEECWEAISYCSTSCYWNGRVEEGGHKFTSVARVNVYKVVSVLDTGSTCVAVKANLVKLSHYIGRSMICICMDGSKHNYLTAIVEIQSYCYRSYCFYFTGVVEAVAIETHEKDVIIGPNIG